MVTFMGGWAVRLVEATSRFPPETMQGGACTRRPRAREGGHRSQSLSQGRDSGGTKMGALQGEGEDGTATLRGWGGRQVSTPLQMCKRG